MSQMALAGRGSYGALREEERGRRLHNGHLREEEEEPASRSGKQGRYRRGDALREEEERIA